MEIGAKTPWKDHMGGVPLHLEYPRGSMFDCVRDIASRSPQQAALDFMGKTTDYGSLVRQVEDCARSLRALGFRAGETFTLAMPNCPQAVMMLYAVNLLGGVSNVVHPLSAEGELAFFLHAAKSRFVLTLDRFYDKFAALGEKGPEHLILASLRDALPLHLHLAYPFTEGRNHRKVPRSAPALRWKDFLKLGKGGGDCAVSRGFDDAAVILYSGGTTGTTKGIVLTNGNFNALSRQVIAANPMFRPGDKMLAAMPLFHGFGLGVCIHSMLASGGRCVLIPRFTPRSYVRLITRCRCSFIAGVPTLYEALLRLPGLEKADMSCLKGVFSGGDSLSTELKRRLDRFLGEHGATVQVREGYGTTETVTACCLTPPHRSKEGSIGVPFPNTYIKIVEPGTERELPWGQEGEILLAGPTVMKEYAGCPEETARTLQKHADGLTWVRTGDLGSMDEEGFVYFRGRAKRLIVSSGYSIYPAQIENVLDGCELVQASCVIGVPDPYRMQAVKAFIVLKAGVKPDAAAKEKILDHCSGYIAKYAMPREIEFRRELPKTPVGKVAYRMLEEEEARLRASGTEERKEEAASQDAAEEKHGQT